MGDRMSSGELPVPEPLPEPVGEPEAPTGPVVPASAPDSESEPEPDSAGTAPEPPGP